MLRRKKIKAKFRSVQLSAAPAKTPRAALVKNIFSRKMCLAREPQLLPPEGASLAAGLIPARFEILRISTDPWPDEDRIALWREALGRYTLRLDVEPLPNTSLHGDLSLHVFPRLTLVAGIEGGVRQQRSRELIADGNDDLVLVISTSGRTIVSQRGCDLALCAQEATLWSAAEIGGFTRPAADRFVALHIPRAAIAALVPRPDDAVMRRIPRSSTALQLLTRYLGFLQEGRIVPEPQFASLFVKQVHELVAATIGTREPAEDANQGIRAARLAAIRADIFANLSQVRLSPKMIAGRHGVTSRYVHLLFEETGKTFCQFVEEERLNRALALLTDPAQATLRIGEIASRVGFAEPSTFHRAFRRYFGDTPGRARRARKEHLWTNAATA